MRRRTALFALALAALPSVARADWPVDGVQLSTAAGGRDNFAAQLFRDASSDVLIDWRRQNNAAIELVQRVTAAGAIAPGWPTDAVTLDFDWLPHASALDGAGGLFEVTATSDVYLERTPSNAVQTYTGPFGVSGDLKSYPGIVSDGTGGCYVGWPGQNAASPYWAVTRMQSDGTAHPGWPAEGLQVATGTGSMGLGQAPGLLLDPLGGVYVVWVGSFARMKRYNADGTLGPGWGISGRVLAPTAPDFARPTALVLSGSDHVIAMWYDKPTAPIVTRVLLRRIDRNGHFDPAWPLGGVELLSSTQSIKSLGMVPDGLGGVWAFWEMASTPYLMHYQSNGTLAPGFPGLTSPLDAAAQYTGNLYAARGGNDGLTVGWTDSRASRPGVRVRWIRGDGTPDPAEPDSARAATPHYPPDPTGPLRAFHRGLLDDGQGGAYVAWDYRDGPLWELMYLGHLAPPPVLGVGPGPDVRTTLALRSVTPNPASREAQVRFTLAGPGPARLELLDIAGRRVRSIDVPGTRSEQVVRFEDLGRLPPGLYVVRLAQGGATRSARVAIVR